MTAPNPRETTKTKLIRTFRWLTLLPFAVILSLAVTALVLAGVNALLEATGYDSDTFVSWVIIVTMRNTLRCSTFICAGVFLAPARKRVVTYLLAGVALAQAVIRLALVLVAPVVDGMTVYGYLTQIVVTLVCALIMIRVEARSR